jgi:hypothetical protein
MSCTYKLSNFSTIVGLSVIDSLKIFHNDTWFPSTTIRYIKFEIKGDEIVFIDRNNIEQEDYIPIDITIIPSNINIDTELNLNQLASVIFSVNQNKNVYTHLKEFIEKIKKNSNDYYMCISSGSMKMFASHVAWLLSSIGTNKTIPDWIYQDALFSEIEKQFERINLRKLTLNDIPHLSMGMDIYSKIMYLSFLLVRDKVSLNKNQENIFYTKIYNGFLLDIKKFNDTLTFT